MSILPGIYASQITGHLSTNSFESIQTVTVGSGGQSSISFSSIPSTYNHLQIRALTKSSNAGAGLNWYVQANSDTATNYSSHQLYADGASAGSNGSANATSFYGNQTTGTSNTNIFGVSIMDILDYSNTSKYKTARCLGGWDANGSGDIELRSSSWRNTAAITSLLIFPEPSRTWGQYTQFALYGIK